MIRAKLLLSAVLIFTLNLSGFSQEKHSGKKTRKNENSTESVKANFVKVNLTSIPLNNYGIQYERILTRRTSVALSGRIMPESAIPFKAKLKDLADNDHNMVDLIDRTSVKNFSITPEVKFSLGKGYGEGAYVSLYYRYSNFDLKGVPINFDADGGGEKTLDIAGTFQSHTGGFLFGWQKNIGSVVVLDLWILGPNIGVGKGTFDGIASPAMTVNEQQNLKDALDDLTIPFVRKTVVVTPNKGSLSIKGPWAGLRSGISLGFRF